MQLQNYQQQQHQAMLASPPPSPLSLDNNNNNNRRAGLPRLSLDTSQERLQPKSPTIIQHGDQSYLKLFSPTLVESPVSYLDEKQQIADKKMWENGPDEAFQKQLDMERRDAHKGNITVLLIHPTIPPTFLTQPSVWNRNNIQITRRRGGSLSLFFCCSFCPCMYVVSRTTYSTGDDSFLMQKKLLDWRRHFSFIFLGSPFPLPLPPSSPLNYG
jgi:hypothetical protein